MHPVNFQDAAGRVGIALSEILFYLFGFIAYLFPVLLSYSAWLSCRIDKDDRGNNYQFNLLRAIGFLAIIVSSCGLLNVEISHFYGGLSFSAGGVVGHLVSAGLISIVNRVGAIVLLFGLFLSGITLFTGFSWMNVIHVTGYLSLLALSGVASLWALWRAKRGSEEIIKPIKSVLDVQEPTLSSLDSDLSHKRKSIRIEPQIQAVNTLRFDSSYETESSPLTSLLDNQPTQTPAKLKKDPPPHNTKIFNKVKVTGDLPSLNLLDPPERNVTKSYSNAVLEQMSRDVEMRLMDFGITVQVVAVHPGPVVTRFELQLAAGLKVSKITSLVKDLARSLSVPSVRIVEVIPGKSVIGLELPNEHRQIVRLSEVLISEQYEQARSPLSLALGKDIAGHPVVVDLAKMPHLLVAGTTGAGKSVGLNAMLLSLLYKATPEECTLNYDRPKNVGAIGL